jgi:hypothetical protein
LLDVKTAVPNAEVQPPVGTHDQAVQIVSQKTKTHAVTGLERFHFIGFTIAVLVTKPVQIGNAGEIDFPFASEHAGGKAVRRFREVSREHTRFVHLAVTIRILQQRQSFRLVRPGGDLGKMLLNLGVVIIERQRSKFFIQPVHVVADVINPGMNAKRFSYINPALFVEGKSHRVGKERLGGKQFGLETLRQFELLDRKFSIGANRFDRRIRLQGGLFLGKCSECKQQR